MIAQSPTQPTIERTTFYTLPRFISQIQHITTIDSGGLEFVICCDKMKLYIFPLIAGGNKPLGNIHQSLPIPNIKSLRTIAKNYLMIETQNKYIGIFEIIKSTLRQPAQKTLTPFQINAVKVEFSQVLKWRIFSSYFIRQVMENLFEVQVFFTDVEFQIFQFTIKNKRGSMSFTISNNGKIQKCNKKQLYGSKCFFNINRKLMYWLKSFSDKQFVIQELSIQPPMGPLGGNKLLNEPFAYFGVQRSEEYKQIYPNLMIRDCINPSKRFGLKLDKDSFLNELKAQIAQVTPSKRKQMGQENPFNELVEQSTYMENITQIWQSFKITTFTDMLMVQNKSKKEVEIYQIKGDGAELIGKQSSQILFPIESKQKKLTGQSGQSSLLELKRWQWHFGNSKKLIGIDKLGFQLKYIQQIALETKQQKIIEAQLVNINQKIQQPERQPSIKNIQQNKTQILPQKQQTPQISHQIKNQPEPQSETEPKRKFSKDQLEKFCHQFNQEDADKYVSKQLIKKVEQVNNWTKHQVLQNQKFSENIKTNFKFKNNREPLQTKKQTSPKTIDPKTSKSPKQQNSTISQKPNDQIKQQKFSTVVEQTLTPKEKPPMKIIQRNKISVAKNFQNPNQSKPNQEQKNEESKKQPQKPKGQAQKQKTSNSGLKKTQNQPNQFTKFRVKDQSAQQTPQQTQKKRFMKNHLSHEIKDQSNQNTLQSEVNQVEQDKEQKNTNCQNSQKEEKVKINVITRASLMKKKQAQVFESKPIEKKEIKTVAQSQTQTEPTKTKDSNSYTNVQVQQEKEIKEQSQILSQESTLQQTQKLSQSEPKTKFIASIDIVKVSKNHLNNCDFLSEDSVSNEDKDPNEGQSIVQDEQHENDQSIEEQIDGDENDPSSKGQPDKQYLIDDDINAEKSPKEQEKVSKQQKVPQINQDQEIQKFCYTLLDDQSVPKYQLKQSQTLKSHTKNPKKEEEVPSLNNTPSFKLDNSGQLTVKNSQAAQNKEQEDEMKKLSSLLFKTSIKRTNIFSSENEQNQDKIRQQNSSNESRDRISDNQKSPKIDQVKEQANVQMSISNKQSLDQSPKQTASPNHINKRSRDWHGSSSEQESEDNQLKLTPNLSFEDKRLSEQPASNNENQSIAHSSSQDHQSPKTESPKDQLKPQQLSPQITTSQKQQKPNPKEIPPNQPTLKQQNTSITKSPKNPFYIQSPTKQSQKNVKSPNDNTINEASLNLFPKSISSSSNSFQGLFTGSVTTNSFTSFKKNILTNPMPLPNIFSSPPPNVIGGSNTNMFKKFLSEREHKKIQQQKKQEQAKPVQAKPSSQLNQSEAKIVQQPKQKPQVKTKQRKQSQKMMIPTSALPQIQQMISKYEQSTIHLLQEQQKTIIKSIEQIPNTHNPYNKNNSLLLPQEIKEEIIKQSKLSVKKWLSTKMLDKVEHSFRQIMQQHKTVYEQALKFYETQARKKITTMQLQYEQQSSILMDIENVSANMCAALQSSILEGEELHTYQLKQWKKQIQQVQTSIIHPLTARVDDSKTYYQNRNKNLQNMTNELKEIKEILKEKLRKKHELKQLKQKKRQQKQQKIKQKIEEQAKLQMLKLKEETKKQTKKRKNMDQNQGHVSFYTQAPQRQNEPQYYQRQPYAYY